MLKKIFKPAWESTSAETRLASLTKLNQSNPEDLEVLTKLIINDADKNVREGALSKINDISELAKLTAKAESTEGKEKIAAACIERLNSCLKDTATPIENIISAYKSADNQLKARLCANCHSDEFRQEQVAALAGNDSALLKVLELCNFSATRFQISELLSDVNTLEQAKRLISGKDKRAERIIKDKLDTIKRAQYAAQEENAQRESILADIDQLALRASEFVNSFNSSKDRTLWRQDHLSQAKTLIHRWQVLLDGETATTANSSEINRFTSACTMIDKANDQLKAVETAETEFPTIINKLAALTKRIDTIETLGAEQEKQELAELEKRWKKHQAIVEAESTVQVSFQTQLTTAQTLINASETISKQLAEQDMLTYLDITTQSGNTAESDETQVKAIIDGLKSAAKLAPKGSQLGEKLTEITTHYSGFADTQRNEFQTSIDHLHKQVNNVTGSVRVKDLPASFGKLKRFNSLIASFLSTFINDAEVKAEPTTEAALSSITDATASTEEAVTPTTDATSSTKKVKLSATEAAASDTSKKSSNHKVVANEKATDAKLEYSNDQIAAMFALALKNTGLIAYQKEALTTLQTRAEETQLQVKELDDWKSFATEPQCLELCDAMEKLANIRDTNEPPLQAKQLSELLNQWKKLGACTACDTHWPRFKSAMDIANEPCAAYFVEQKAEKQKNLTTLKELSANMLALTQEISNDENVDCNAYIKKVHYLDNEWKKFQHVDRAKGQQVWKQFKDNRDAAYNALEPYFADNLSRKETLCKRAEKILNEITEKGATDTSLDTLKQLQTSWKQIGAAKQRKDAKAWREFKGHCDAIYGKIQDGRNQLRAEDDKFVDERYKIIKAISALSKSSKIAGELERDYSQLQEQYQALTPLAESVPEKKQKAIDKSYRFACNDVEKAKTQLKAKQQNNELDLFVEKAKLANKIRAEKSTDKQSTMQEQWQALELSNQSLKNHAKKFLDDALKGSAIDTSALEQEKRLLCIQAELASNSMTPKEDQALRTQYQLQQMQKKGLGKTKLENSQMAYKVAWYNLPTLESKLEKSLTERLESVMDKLKG